MIFSTPIFSQCDAKFTSVRNDFTINFYDRSTGFENPTYLWYFGDGTTSTSSEPSHLYDAVGAYDVSLTISDQNCERIVNQRIEICDLEISHSFDPICQSNFNRLYLVISDPSGVIEEVDVYLDDKKLNDAPIALTDGIAGFNPLIVGDGKTHTLLVTSTNSTTCKVYRDIEPINCLQTCQNFNLQVTPIGTGTHNVTVRDGSYDPADLNITLGDMVKFTWEADGVSVTSIDNDLDDHFDTGIRNTGYEYFLSVTKPGTHLYRDRSNNQMSGSITATCPDDGQSRINLTFENNKTPEEGFYISVDGFIMYDQVYAYDQSGITSIDYMLPGDGLRHFIEIYDIKTGCTIKDYISAIDCDMYYDCRLRLSYEQVSRCDNDSLDYRITVDALSSLTEQVELYKNGKLLGEFPLANRQSSQVYTFHGDAVLDTIVVYDDMNFHCLDTLIFNQKDCSIPCSMGNLELYGGVGDTKVFSVSRETFFDEPVYSEVGESIFLQWIDEELLGIRVEDRTQQIIYDSGLSNLGKIEVLPLLKTGRNTFTIYSETEDLTQFTLYVVSTCEGNEIPINYSFIDTSGHINGYNIYVDGEKHNTVLIPYNVGGENYGSISIPGDDNTHTIVFRDAYEYGCSVQKELFVPSCDILDCGVSFSVTPQDSCYNGDFAFVDVVLDHPDPIGDRVDIRRDGISISPFLYAYDDEGKVIFTEYLPSDGRAYAYSYQDNFDPTCNDVIIYQSKECDTECVFSDLKIENVNATFLINNPTTPIEYVGCQDSLSYISISFRERYSDASKYYVFMDERHMGTYDLHPGDTINQIFIELYGDARLHEFTIQSTTELDCAVTGTVMTPECYNPCKIVLDDVVNISCKEEISTQGVILNPDFNADRLYLLLDDEEIAFERKEDTIYFNLRADGLEHHIKVGSTKPFDDHCFDEIYFTADYCLNCYMDATANLISMCDEADSLIYRIAINEGFSGEYTVTYKNVTTELNSELHGTAFDISVLGDGRESVLTFQSKEDIFCKSTLIVETFDCSPIICEPDFTYSFDGYEGTFVDNSVSSEEIKEHRWEVGGFLTFSNLDQFSYTFDSIATYEVCRYITTDSCSNSICKMIELPDPCKMFESKFDYEVHNDTIILGAKVKGDYDVLYYDLGDGSVYSDPQLIHVYKDEGVYEVCLTAKNETMNCEDIYCEEISVIISSTNNDLFSQLKIYPNPLPNDATLHIDHESYTISEASLYTLDGKKVSSRLIKGAEKSIVTDINNLNSGIYLLSLHLNNQVIYKKIFIE